MLPASSTTTEATRLRRIAPRRSRQPSAPAKRRDSGLAFRTWIRAYRSTMDLPLNTARDDFVPPTWVPVGACTLPTRKQPLRVAEFDALFAAALRSVERPAGG